MHKSSFLLSMIGCLLISSCASVHEVETTTRPTESSIKVRTEVENTWNKDARAIAEEYDGLWEFHGMEAGKSVVVRLYRYDFLVGSSDGMSYHEIGFQLPPDIRAGQEISLRPVPTGRSAIQKGKYSRLAPMKDGEIVAFMYANPLMGWMKKCKISKVKIISVGDTEAVIKFRLKADLEKVLDFDIDEQFTLKVTKPEQREIQRIESDD